MDDTVVVYLAYTKPFEPTECTVVFTYICVHIMMSYYNTNKSKAEHRAGMFLLRPHPCLHLEE